MRLLSSYTEYIETVKAINAYNGMHLLENIEERLCNARNRCKLEHSNLTEMKEASEDLYRLAKLRDLGETLKRCTQQFQEAFISLMNYRNSSESIDIDDRIARAIGEYNALINIGKQAYASEKSNIYDGVDVKSGINAYDEYLRLKMNKENGEVFDAEALRNSYDAITNLFQVTQPLRMQLPVSKK